MRLCIYFVVRYFGQEGEKVGLLGLRKISTYSWAESIKSRKACKTLNLCFKNFFPIFPVLIEWFLAWSWYHCGIIFKSRLTLDFAFYLLQERNTSVFNYEIFFHAFQVKITTYQFGTSSVLSTNPSKVWKVWNSMENLILNTHHVTNLLFDSLWQGAHLFLI